MSDERVMVLHGTNYWNMGDLGLMVAMLESLRSELERPEIEILSQFEDRPKAEGQQFDISELQVSERPWITLSTTDSRLLRAAHLAGQVVTNLVLLALVRMLGEALARKLPLLRRSAALALASADVIVSKPGGFIHGKYAVPGAYHLSEILLATCAGPPVVIYAQSVGPFGRRSGVTIASRILERTQAVLVRDRPSLRTCLDELELPEEKVRLTADEAFLLEAPGAETHGPGTTPEDGDAPARVGVTVLNWHFLYSKDPEGSRRRYVNEAVRLIDHLHEEHRARVSLYPFLLRRQFRRHDEDISRRVATSVQHPERVEYVRRTDPRALKSHMRDLDVFVGSRMHSNIFALGNTVPVLAIAYLPKTRGIMGLLGLDDYVVDIDDLPPGRLVELFERVWYDRRDYRRHLRAALSPLRDRARLNARICARLARGEEWRDLRSDAGPAGRPPTLDG